MLLVDHHEPEPGHRREDRAARPEHDVGLAVAHAPVLLGALGARHGRVPDADPLAEARPQARQELGRECDLGHEHDRAAARRPRLGDRAQVDLGLARAGHAVQQQRPALAHRADGRLERLRLVGRERPGGSSRAGAGPPTDSSARAAGARASRAMIPSAAMRRSVGIVVPAARHSSAAAMRPAGRGQGVGHGPPAGAPGGRGRREQAPP